MSPVMSPALDWQGPGTRPEEMERLNKIERGREIE